MPKRNNSLKLYPKMEDRGLSQLSSYLYYAGGERTLKLQGPYESMYQNGQLLYNYFNISPYTLYTSPYMVLTPESYTKHYYIEADRVVSKIGGGMKSSITPVGDPVYGFGVQDGLDYDDKNAAVKDMMGSNAQSLGLNAQIIIEPAIEWWLKGATSQDDTEDQLFFYHKDQLGSSTQISDASAAIIHHIEYMPYGENYFEMKSTWEAPYKFNGKELDSETGMYYYGARYYSPELSVWLSVDSLSDNYSSTSPYMYCLGNPIILYDPDGNQGWPAAAKQAMGHDNYVQAHSVENLSRAYNSLPENTQRMVGGVWKVVTGGAQTAGGIAIGSATSVTGVGIAVGAALTMHGAYKLGEGVHQIVNVLSGAKAETDPKYNTPIGAATKSELVDNVADLAIGAYPTKVSSAVTVINKASTAHSAVSTGVKVIEVIEGPAVATERQPVEMN